MSRITIALAALCIGLLSCSDSSKDPNSPDRNEIPIGEDMIQFGLGSKSVDSSQNTVQIVQEGTVYNRGSEAISAPWYIAATFFTNIHFLDTIGESVIEMKEALPAKQSTQWVVRISSSQFNLKSYPDFVAIPRAFYLD